MAREYIREGGEGASLWKNSDGSVTVEKLGEECFTVSKETAERLELYDTDDKSNQKSGK